MIYIQDNIACFTVTKTGRKVKGTYLGRDTVRVRMLLNNDKCTVAGLDLAKVQQNVDSLKEAFDGDLMTALYSPEKPVGLITSLAKAATTRQASSKYEPHSQIRGLYRSFATGCIYVRGIRLSEEILIADPNGPAPASNRKEITILKDEISSFLGLHSPSWRQYKLPPNTPIQWI